jgi:hypothetical protein
VAPLVHGWVFFFRLQEVSMPGPVPNRSDDLARPRERGNASDPGITQGTLRPVTMDQLEPGEDWHPIAVRVWESCHTSGQADFYQDSDWAILWSLCEDLSHYKQGSKGVDRETGELYNKPRSGQMLQAIMSQLNSLLLTEGERRRVRIELTQPDEGNEEATVLSIVQGLKDSMND